MIKVIEESKWNKDIEYVWRMYIYIINDYNYDKSNMTCSRAMWDFFTTSVMGSHLI